MILVAIAGLVCLIWVFRYGSARALIAVVLPVLMVLPEDFFLRLPHTPAIGFGSAVLGALGIGLLLQDSWRWRFSPMDLWVGAFIATGVYSERLLWGVNGSGLRLLTDIMGCWFPYMVGKLLLNEPGLRSKITQSVVGWMTVASILSLPQLLTKSNPFLRFWSHLFPGQWPDVDQTRMGLGRVSGPYGMAEGAGMVLLIGVGLAFWLQKNQELLPLRRPKLSLFILVATLLGTQSRGPILGTIVVLSIASIGRAEAPFRRMVVVLGFIVLIGLPGYIAFRQYISEPVASIGSLQQTAQYRKLLVDNYVPLAKLGGAWGWGNTFPHPGGQDSIDNEYLLVWLLQGYVGLSSFVLILLDAATRLVRASILAKVPRNRHLILSLLGIVLGMALCVGTVSMGNQAYTLFFIVIGWSQSIRVGHDETRGEEQGETGREINVEDTMLVFS